MKTNKFLSLLVMALMVLASVQMVSCGSDDPSPTPGSGPTTTLSVSESNINFAANGGSQVVHISSNSTWTITTGDYWIRHSETNGTGDRDVTVTAQSNTNIHPRQGTITIKTTDGSATKVISISQVGNGGNPTSTVRLKSGYTHTIANGKGKIWTSSNPLIASIDDNVITANKVGQVTVSSEADGGRFITVIVEPAFLYYTEPYTQWGASKSTVKSNISLQIYSEDATSITYNGTGNVNQYYYSFTNGVLNGAMVSYKNLSAVQVDDFLFERYVAIGTSGDYRYYRSLDGKVVVGLDLSNSIIAYMNAATLNSPMQQESIKAIISKMPSIK